MARRAHLESEIRVELHKKKEYFQTLKKKWITIYVKK